MDSSSDFIFSPVSINENGLTGTSMHTNSNSSSVTPYTSPSLTSNSGGGNNLSLKRRDSDLPGGGLGLGTTLREDGRGEVDPEPGGARNAKRRAAQACFQCRKHKIRCEGGKPCNRCRASYLECEFDRPGPSAGYNINNVEDSVRQMQEERISALEERLRKVESWIRFDPRAAGVGRCLFDLDPSGLGVGLEGGVTMVNKAAGDNLGSGHRSLTSSTTTASMTQGSDGGSLRPVAASIRQSRLQQPAPALTIQNLISQPQSSIVEHHSGSTRSGYVPMADVDVDVEGREFDSPQSTISSHQQHSSPSDSINTTPRVGNPIISNTIGSVVTDDPRRTRTQTQTPIGASSSQSQSQTNDSKSGSNNSSNRSLTTNTSDPWLQYPFKRFEHQHRQGSRNGKELERGIRNPRIFTTSSGSTEMGTEMGYKPEADPCSLVVGNGEREDPVSLDLVSLEEARYLFNVFMKRCNPSFPIVFEPDFDSVRRDSRFLFSTILAVAARFFSTKSSGLPRRHDDVDFCDGGGGGGGGGRGGGGGGGGRGGGTATSEVRLEKSTYLQISSVAFGHLSRTLLCNQHWFEDVQALIILSHWGLWSDGFGPDPWVLTGHAFRLAVSTGLAQQAGRLRAGLERDGDGDGRGVGNLGTYCAVYATDRFFSLSYGRRRTEGLKLSQSDIDLLIDLSSKLSDPLSRQRAAMMAAQAELGRIVNIYLETIEGFRELNEDCLNADLGSVEREMLAQGMIESTTAELGKWMERWGQRCHLSARLDEVPGPAHYVLTQLWMQIRLCCNSVALTPELPRDPKGTSSDTFTSQQQVMTRGLTRTPSTSPSPTITFRSPSATPARTALIEQCLRDAVHAAMSIVDARTASKPGNDELLSRNGGSGRHGGRGWVGGSPKSSVYLDFIPDHFEIIFAHASLMIIRLQQMPMHPSGIAIPDSVVASGRGRGIGDKGNKGSSSSSLGLELRTLDIPLVTDYVNRAIDSLEDTDRSEAQFASYLASNLRKLARLASLKVKNKEQPDQEAAQVIASMQFASPTTGLNYAAAGVQANSMQVGQVHQSGGLSQVQPYVMDESDGVNFQDGGNLPFPGLHLDDIFHNDKIQLNPSYTTNNPMPSVQQQQQQQQHYGSVQTMQEHNQHQHQHPHQDSPERRFSVDQHHPGAASMYQQIPQGGGSLTHLLQFDTGRGMDQNMEGYQ